MEALKNFYYLKVINSRNGKRGFVCERDGNILISNVLAMDILKKFDTYQEAQRYMRDNKIERSGVTAHIRDLEDLKKEGLVSSTKEPVFTVTNDNGDKIFFDNLTENYHFDNKEFGFCIWKTEKDVEDFISACEFPCEVKCLKIN